MGFETFQRQRVAAGRDPAVTIQRKGVISLNIPAYEALGKPEAVELLYDRVEKLVGLRKADPSVEHAYMVRGLGRAQRYNSNWLISGTAFTQFYEIPTETARRWIGSMQDDMLVIDLKEPGLEVTGNRKPATSTPTSAPGEAPLPVSERRAPESPE